LFYLRPSAAEFVPNKNRSIEGMERSRITVSPFDGANRIRFKGSQDDCGIAIADCGLPAISIGNSGLRIRGSLDSRSRISDNLGLRLAIPDCGSNTIRIPKSEIRNRLTLSLAAPPKYCLSIHVILNPLTSARNFQTLSR